MTAGDIVRTLAKTMTNSSSRQQRTKTMTAKIGFLAISTVVLLFVRVKLSGGNLPHFARWGTLQKNLLICFVAKQIKLCYAADTACACLTVACAANHAGTSKNLSAQLAPLVNQPQPARKPDLLLPVFMKCSNISQRWRPAIICEAVIKQNFPFHSPLLLSSLLYFVNP